MEAKAEPTPTPVPELEPEPKAAKRRAGKGKRGKGDQAGTAASAKKKGAQQQQRAPVVEVSSQLSRFHTEAIESTYVGVCIEGVTISVAGRELLADTQLKLDHGKR